MMERGRRIAPRRWALAAVALMAAALLWVPACAAQEEATIELSNWSAGLLFGYRWGHGTLEIQGRKVPFRVRGFSFLDLGVSSQEITGKVIGLRDARDFDGIYTMFTAGGPWGDNELTRERRIAVKWSTDVTGVEAKLGFDWVSFRLE